MRWRVAAVAGLSVLGLMIPTAAFADGERESQVIDLGPVPDFLVGQFAEVRASASSGLPVILTTEGPCVLRDLPGAANAILVATAAGTCVLTADQPGDANFLPAARQSRLVAMIKSEVDLTAVIPGADRIEPGDPLTVFADVVGENGDDPIPSGNVRYTVKNASGEEIEARENIMDGRGESMVEFPESSTVNWAEGVYRVYVWYRGDEGYYAAIADPLPFYVGPASKDSGAGGIGMDIDPRSATAGSRATVTLTGFPQAARGSVTFTIINPRVSDRPITAQASVEGESVSYSFDTGPAGVPGTMVVKASYSYYYDDLVYSDTLRADYVVRARTTPTIVLQSMPAINGLRVVYRPSRMAPLDLNKRMPAVLDFDIIAPDGLRPSVSATGPSAAKCAATTQSVNGTTTRVKATSATSCQVTVSTPLTDQYVATAYSFDFVALCSGTPCAPGGRGGVEPTDPRAPQSGRTIVLGIFPPEDLADAPELDVVVGEAVHLRVPWPTVGDVVKVSVGDGNRWRSLGSSTVGEDGYLNVPTFQVQSAGGYVLRFMDNATGFVGITGVPCPTGDLGSCEK